MTERLLAVPCRPDRAESVWRYAGGPDRHLMIQHYGWGSSGLEIGGLEGDAFRLVLRNLPDDQATDVAGRRKINHLCLNCFDTQRFGVPGRPKLTHRVGAAMASGQWDLALAELVALRSPQYEAARAWAGAPGEYFRAIHPRTASFYLAAHASWAWNKAVSELITGLVPERAFNFDREGIPYSSLASTPATVRVMAYAYDLLQSRMHYRDGELTTRHSHRATVVQTLIWVQNLRADAHFPDRHQVELCFFLPSGSYATAAVPQLLGNMC